MSSLDLCLDEGEVVGLTGLSGSGFEDLPYLLAGARAARGGVIHVGGRRIDLRTAAIGSCLRAGIVLVPERRDRDGLALDLTISDNIALPTLRTRGRRYFVSRRWQQQQTRQAIETLGIRAGSPHQPVKQLSGGNQQKVLLAKWLSTGPRLLILHEPAQAVDVGARLDLLHAIRRAADDGVAVLLVSIEPTDLVAACDRILVYRAPSQLRELRTTEPDRVLEAVYGRSAVSQEGPET
jgi:ribose transport system ATP-binding protein